MGQFPIRALSTMPAILLLVFILVISVWLTGIAVLAPLQFLDWIGLPLWPKLVLLLLLIAWCFGE